jgi:hypothetical protein
MPTIGTQEIIDEMIACNGVYPGDEDNPVVRIVRFTDQGGKRMHGVVYASDARIGHLHKYDQVSEYIKDPVVIFEREF